MEGKSRRINDHFNPIILRNVLTRNWYKPIIVFLAVFGTTFLYLRYKKPIYESKAVLQLLSENKTQKILEQPSNIVEGPNLSEQIELLKSPVLLDQAIQRLYLNTSIFNDGQLLTENLYGVTPFSIITYELKDSSFCGSKVFFKKTNSTSFELSYSYKGQKRSLSGILGKELQNSLFHIKINSRDAAAFSKLIEDGNIYFVFNNPRQLLKEFQAGLTIKPIDENAKTIEISFRNENRKLTFDLIQSIITSYFTFEKTKHQEENLKTLSFINSQLDSLSGVLGGSKDSLSLFQRREGLPSIEYEENNITTNLNGYSLKLAEINEEIYTIGYLKSLINNQLTRPDLYKILPQIIGKRSFEGAFTRQVEELNKLLETKEDISQDISYESNKVQLINRRIENNLQLIHKSLNIIRERLFTEKKQLSDSIIESS